MSLGQRSISAVFWGTGGSAARIVLQLLTQIVLARLLGPNEYGVFAIGAIVISFSGFFSDIGLAYGLIQKREVSELDIRFVFTWQIILGTAVSALVASFAGVIANFFGEARAVDVIRALSVLCLINALAAASLNLLKRELDFKTQQVAFLVSYVIGYCLLGIPMALLGLKVWALVAAWCVQSAAMSVLLYRVARHPVRPLLWYDQAREQAQYGGTVLFTNLLNWLIGNIDRVIIGRLLSAHAVGLYATSYNLIYNPTASVLGVLQPVFFSASARLAEDKTEEKLERGFITLVAAISVFFLPACTVLAAIAPDFVQVLYGSAWAAAGSVLRPLALAMPFFLIWGMCTPLLWASGNASQEFRTQWPLAIAWGLACWGLAIWGGVEAVAWGALALFVIRCAVVMRMALGLTKLRPHQVLAAARGGTLLSLTMGVVALMVDTALAAQLPALRLGAVSLCSLLVFVAAFRTVPGVLSPELRDLLTLVLHKLPPRLAVRFEFLTRRKTT